MKSNLLFAMVTFAAVMIAAPSASAQHAVTAPDPFTSSSPAEEAPEIKSFTAVSKNDKVYINWTATDRTGETIYILERSLGGKSFQQLGTKKGAPSPGSQALLFSFIDNKPVNGKITYRVQQVTNDGIVRTAIANVIYDNTAKDDKLAWKE